MEYILDADWVINALAGQRRGLRRPNVRMIDRVLPPGPFPFPLLPTL
jgi:hypothetical protein